MKNFSLEKVLLFLGDKSRYIFAKELTGVLPPDYENYSLILEHGETVSEVQKRENFLRLSSFKTPPGIKIFLSKADEVTTQAEQGKFSRLIVFEEFPFKKDSTQQLIETWQNLPRSKPPLSIVVMDLFHRQGSTDLDRLDDTILEAQRSYEAQELDVILFRSAADVIDVLHHHESLISKHKKVLSNELAQIHERLYELDFLYDDFIMDCNDKGGCLSLAAVNGICSFDSVKLSGKNSFWEAYNEAALKKLFPSDTSVKGYLNDLIKIYSYVLKGDGATNFSASRQANNLIEQGKAELAQILIKSFLAYMSSRKFADYVSPYEFRDIVSYKKLTGDRNGRFYGINAEYKQRLSKFVEQETKIILKSALDSYINFLERVVR